MSRLFRAIAEIANLCHGLFGSSAKQPFSRRSLEDLVGRRAARAIVAVPVVTVTAWLLLWVVARLFDWPAGEDPFTWIRHFGQ